jgi:hypothetical protein
MMERYHVINLDFGIFMINDWFHRTISWAELRSGAAAKRPCRSPERQLLSVGECVLLEMSHDLVAGHANDAHFVQYFQIDELRDCAIALVMSARFPVELNIIHVGEVTDESQVHPPPSPLRWLRHPSAVRRPSFWHL